MSTLNFFQGYKAQPVKASRFGIIPVGEHTVKVIDVQALMSSQSFRLDDNGKITDVIVKDSFDQAFDQEILAVVFQNESGQVLIDRRSSKGWLHDDDKWSDTTVGANGHIKGSLIATPQMIQQYGLKAVGNRFVDKKGKGIESKGKTQSCLEIVDRLCDACEVENPMDIIGKMLDIQVVAKPKANSDDTTNEVSRYAKAGVGFKTKATTIGATQKEELKPAPVIAGDMDDDLPF